MQEVRSARTRRCLISPTHCFDSVAARRWYTFTQLNGSLKQFVDFAQAQGFQGLWQAWPKPSREAWLTLISFGVVQAALQRFVPGKRFEGPVTPNGNTPVYKVGWQDFMLMHKVVLILH